MSTRCGNGRLDSRRSAGGLTLQAGGHPLAAVAPLVAGRTDAMQTILEEALAAAGRERAWFARIAAPPLLDDELLAQITGEPGFLGGRSRGGCR